MSGTAGEVWELAFVPWRCHIRVVVPAAVKRAEILHQVQKSRPDHSAPLPRERAAVQPHRVQIQFPSVGKHGRQKSGWEDRDGVALELLLLGSSVRRRGQDARGQVARSSVGDGVSEVLGSRLHLFCHLCHPSVQVRELMFVAVPVRCAGQSLVLRLLLPKAAFRLPVVIFSAVNLAEDELLVENLGVCLREALLDFYGFRLLEAACVPQEQAGGHAQLALLRGTRTAAALILQAVPCSLPPLKCKHLRTAATARNKNLCIVLAFV